VLEAVKVGGGYGAVVVERLVLRLDEDKLHQDIDHRADDYHYELEVADARHLKPDRRRVGVVARPHQEQGPNSCHMPMWTKKTPGAMPHERASGSLRLCAHKC
jgi:hypothetical protein